MNPKISLAYKVSDDQFIAIIQHSTSCADAMRKLGFKCISGNASIRVRTRVAQLNIDVAHWSDNTVNAHKAITISNEEYFKKDAEHSGKHIHDRLLKYNLLPYKCSCCGNPGIWNGKKLVLQVHHINGDHKDNRLENLQFICPNCHSQTDTFAGKNAGKHA